MVTHSNSKYSFAHASDRIMEAIPNQEISIWYLNDYIIDLNQNTTQSNRIWMTNRRRNDQTNEYIKIVWIVSLVWLFFINVPSHHINVIRFDINVAQFSILISLAYVGLCVWVRMCLFVFVQYACLPNAKCLRVDQILWQPNVSTCWSRFAKKGTIIWNDLNEISFLPIYTCTRPCFERIV